MSGWTIITVRGKTADEYDLTRNDWEHDRSYATEDIAATFDKDSRIRAWTTGGYDHVYALLMCGRYDWGFAEDVFEDYAELIDDAVVLGWNDTTDAGCARYYDRPDLGRWIHQYEENRNGECGERACAVMYAQHGIHARNPFHNNTGKRDDKRADSGSIVEKCLP